jgi:hypothetical protein
MAQLTLPQRRALAWLKDRGGDGCFTRSGVALAQGDLAPFERPTWNKLQELGYVEFYGGVRDGGKGHGRLRLVGQPGHQSR